MSKDKFVELAFGLPINNTFHYAIPERLQESICVGKRVWAPFGSRRLIGYVLGFAAKPEVPRVKEIESVIDEEPILNGELLELAERISEYYCSSLGEAIEAAVPAPLKRGKTKVTSRTKDLFVEEIEPSNDLVPTKEQSIALEAINKSVFDKKKDVFLLHGVTSSGKTEVYLQAIGRALKRGLFSIVLIPEISLTPQTVERFKARFKEEVAVLHSRLSGGQHFEQWQLIKKGKAHIVVGARSALFAPVGKLGLIVVDEEHESSYKQEDIPRYNARDAARMRAHIAGCPLILGSATPSMESYYEARRGRYKLLTLNERIDNRPMPTVRIVDMCKQLGGRKRSLVFSRALQANLGTVLKEGKQAILFLNRRGFSTFISCRSCGFVMKCKRCDSTLVFHFKQNELRCHYCNKRSEAPRICPECESSYIGHFGIGTEKVESEVHRLFPGARIERMDTDVTRKRGSHERILGAFKRGHIDILVGTQMIAKGLDFPQVTLVGVVSADITLNLPDFRASERTFDLLTQVGGRAGRGEDKGSVIVQTYTPEHYTIKSALHHDYGEFYDKEILSRKELSLPPFTKIVKMTLRSSKEEKAKAAASIMKDRLKEVFTKKGVKIIGPAPSPMVRLRGQYRWNIMLKGKDPAKICSVLRKEVLGLRGIGAFLTVDVDPISL
ncbi:MAG: primosomal protein N' [Candidatus Omnitrophica bacterium]|nr:primosomal protein N' [Candidatus Omnitrophota bacterium]